jgi:hypothetical protein
MRRWYLLKTRRAMPQLHLNFTDIPIAETCLWEQFDDKQRQIVIETLARLLTKTTRAEQHEEQTND